MPIRLLGSLLSLMAALSMYGVYVALIVPIVDGTDTGRRVVESTIPREPPAARFEQVLQAHFPDGSWERGEVNVLRTRQLLLIWKSHETVEDRRLRVYPLSIVLIDDSSRKTDEPATHAKRRSWVIRAPAGAILQFDDDLNLAAGRFGRFHSGFIPGTVTTVGGLAASPVAGPATAATAHSEDQPIEILTRNLQFDDRRIWTSDEVSFQWGPNFGTGRDLLITMAPGSTDRRSSSALPGSAVESLRLMRLDRLHLTTPARSDQFPGLIHAPLDVTAQGTLLIDLVSGVCRLADRVHVERRNAEGQWQRLKCDELSLHFANASTGGADRLTGTAESATVIPRFILTRVVAKGEPVTVESNAESSPNPGHHMLEARSVRYQFPSGGMTSVSQPAAVERTKVPGSLVVTGPGRIVMQRDTHPPQQFGAQFERTLEWLPQGEGGLLSMKGAAACTAVGMGNIAAQSMELQVRLDPTSSFGWQPVRMTGQGGVTVSSSRLRVIAGDMQVMFVGPKKGNEPVQGTLQLGDPRANAEPVIDLHDPQGPRIDMQGDHIELQLAGTVPRLSLHAAALLGRVRCQESPDSPTGLSRAAMEGDEIRYVDLGRSQWRIDVTGKPAVVKTESAELTGTNIHVDAAQNRAWMDGPGIASLPLPRQFSVDVPGEPARAQLTWNRDMEFDGSQLVCRDGVSCRGPYQLLRGRLLRLALQQPIQLGKLQIRQHEISLATTTLEGDVFCENRTVEQDGLVSIDTAQLHQLAYDHGSGRLEGLGPGWVETVRRGDRPWLAGTPGGDEFRFLRVDFERSLQGDLPRREIRFGDYVRTVYGPVSGWSERIIATRREELPSDGLLLRCRELVVLQAQTGTRATRPLEFLALRETTIDGREFTATAERLSYDQAKDLLILEGNERTQAQIWYQAQSGDKRSKEVARKILYWPKTRQLKIEGLQFLEFRTTGK